MLLDVEQVRERRQNTDLLPNERHGSLHILADLWEEAERKRVVDGAVGWWSQYRCSFP